MFFYKNDNNIDGQYYFSNLKLINCFFSFFVYALEINKYYLQFWVLFIINCDKSQFKVKTTITNIYKT